MMSKSKKSKASSPKRVASKQIAGSSKVMYKPMSPKKTGLKIAGINMFALDSWSSFMNVKPMPMFPFAPVVNPESRFNVPAGSYPPGFDICGYAKELFDENKGKRSFEYTDFHTAMFMYSNIFCYEKELRTYHNSFDMNKNLGWAPASFEGILEGLNKMFKKIGKLLKKVDAVAMHKHEEIKEIHTKNILGLLHN
jgi:hypothetical protein